MTFQLVSKAELNREIFRAYDIRGVVPDDLNCNTVYSIGCAIGSAAQANEQSEVIIGRDGRLSGPDLIEALAAGIQAAGCDVLDIGMVTTPMLYFATHHCSTQSGVMLTGSHNPANYNGLKIVIAGTTLAEADIADLHRRITDHDLLVGNGHYAERSIEKRYITAITDSVKLHKPLKVVIDCGNGVGGVIAPKVFKALGCEVETLFCEVDGTFPNHHPDPSIMENLQDLMTQVQATGADIGFAFDGDADRLGVVTNQGEVILPDRQMMCFAQAALQEQPGSEIIYDVKCSKHLAEVILQAGGKPTMWKTGHSLVKAKLKETGASLAGEMSGHIFFKQRWFGFDDGVYAGVRLLEILAKQCQSASELFAALPDSVNTPELKLPIPESRKFTLMEALAEQASFGEAKIHTIDGLRVEFDDGWGLVRPSNTTPYLILRFEADDELALSRIQALFREQLLKLDNNLSLPF